MIGSPVQGNTGPTICVPRGAANDVYETRVCRKYLIPHAEWMCILNAGSRDFKPAALQRLLNCRRYNKRVYENTAKLRPFF
jgi:hypothetical protein